MNLALKINNPWEGASVFVKERTSSTMDDALELARGGHPSGTAVVAGSQTSGRGRVPGRKWVDAPWQSLLVSLFFHERDVGCPVQLLPMAAAVAVCRAVVPFLSSAPLLRAGIKWPNDVLVDGRKLCGILWEKRAAGEGSVLVVGIGINCSQEVFPPELAGACSLRQLTGREVQVLDVCARLLPELHEVLRGNQWMDEMSDRLALRGQRVTVRAPGSEETVSGTVVGLDPRGGLILRAPDGGETVILQAEISGSP